MTDKEDLEKRFNLCAQESQTLLKIKTKPNQKLLELPAVSALRLRSASPWDWRTFFNQTLSSDLHMTQKFKILNFCSQLGFRHLFICLFGPQWVPSKPLEQGEGQIYSTRACKWKGSHGSGIGETILEPIPMCS